MNDGREAVVRMITAHGVCGVGESELEVEHPLLGDPYHRRQRTGNQRDEGIEADGALRTGDITKPLAGEGDVEKCHG